MLAVVCVVLYASGVASAQGYPECAIRYVVPFPAGGEADLVARSVAVRLSALITPRSPSVPQVACLTALIRNLVKP